jgi:hypothetical protein
MGGQACVFYGAAQVSKDVDLVLLAEAGNYRNLQRAMDSLQAKRIAVPPFDPSILARGHAVHFRCAGAGVEDLRVDVMTRLRGLPDFPQLWDRRTVVGDETGYEFHLLSVPDLVQAKKTQRAKDWPMIELLVAIHYRENAAQARPDWINFWLQEARTIELLQELISRFPSEAHSLRAQRPLLQLASSLDSEKLREAFDAEIRAEQARDRAYWAPLKTELETFRRTERGGV